MQLAHKFKVTKIANPLFVNSDNMVTIKSDSCSSFDWCSGDEELKVNGIFRDVEMLAEVGSTQEGPTILPENVIIVVKVS